MNSLETYDFGQVFSIIPDSKSKVKSSSYLESGKNAVVDQGKGLVAGYTNGILTADKDLLPVIVFGDHTRAVKYVDFPFTAGADGTKILKPTKLMNVKYGYYLVLNAVSQIPSKGYARHFGELKKMLFQLPSLEVQGEIVKKLDSAFDEIDFLEQNLDQIEEKRALLLGSFLSKSFTKTSVPVIPLGTVAEVIAGQSPEGTYYNASADGMAFYQGKKEFAEKFIGPPTTWTTKITKVAEPGDILMSVRAPVGPINFTQSQICIGRGLAAIRAGNSIDKNYLYYFLLHKQPEIFGNTGAVFDSINKDQIAAIEIPVPPIGTQLEIVANLNIALHELNLLRDKTISRKYSASALRKSLLSGALMDIEEVA